MIKRLNVLFLSLLFFIALSATDSAGEIAGRADSTDSIRRNLREIEAICNHNMKKYIPYTVESSAGSWADKMEKGNFYFEKGDYVTAADLFFLVVELHPENDGDRLEALSKLAESLFRQKNYVSAAKYCEMVVSATENREYRAQCLKRIVESNYYLGNYAAAKEYYDKFSKSAGEPDSELLYYVGKSLFYDKRFSDSVTVFYAVKKDTEFYPQARYFLGMLSIKEHEYDDALSFYEEVATLDDNGKYHKFDEIRELSALAAARVAFETGNLDKASYYYGKTNQRSESFAKAHYELGWAYIRQGDLEKALSSLRLIKILAPHAAVVPEAEALEGSLLVQTKQYGEAMVLFDSMVKKYGRMQDELFFVDGKIFMLNGKPRHVSDFLLPYSPLLQSLLKDNKKYVNAVELNENLIRLEEELEQISSRENKLTAMIGNKNIAAVYPPLKMTARKTLFLRDRIAAIKNNLVMMRKSAAEDAMSDYELSRFDELESKKRGLLDISETRVIDPKRIRERAEEYSARVGRDEEEIHNISAELASMSKDLEAVIAFYTKEHRVTEKYEKEFIEMVISERENLRDMAIESDSCRDELESEKNSLTFGGGIEAREIEIRDALNSIADRQYVLVKGDMLSEIHRLMGEADRIDRKLAGFYAALNDAIAGLVNTVRVSYEKEKSDIDGYRSEIAAIRREVEELSVLAMYSDVNAVKTSVSAYMLQGDMGIADIVWEKKEDDTSEILRLKTLKAKEIQQLYLNLDGEQ